MFIDISELLVTFDISSVTTSLFLVKKSHTTAFFQLVSFQETFEKVELIVFVIKLLFKLNHP